MTLHEKIAAIERTRIAENLAKLAKSKGEVKATTLPEKTLFPRKDFAK